MVTGLPGCVVTEHGEMTRSGNALRQLLHIYIHVTLIISDRVWENRPYMLLLLISHTEILIAS